MKEELNGEVSGLELQMMDVIHEEEVSYVEIESTTLIETNKFTIVDPLDIIQKKEQLEPPCSPTLEFSPPECSSPERTPTPCSPPQIEESTKRIRKVKEQFVISKDEVKITPKKTSRRKKKTPVKNKKLVASKPPVQKKKEISVKSQARITIQFKKPPIRKKKQSPEKPASKETKPSPVQNKNKTGGRSKRQTVAPRGRLTSPPSRGAVKRRKPSVKKNKLYICQLCDKTYTIYSSYFHHLSNIHGRNAQPHTCDFCGKTMKNKNSMLHHMRRNHLGPQKGRMHTCGLCGDKYKTKWNLLVHKKRNH